MPRKDAYTGPISAQAQQDLVSEGIENYELPKSIVMRIAKSSVCFFEIWTKNWNNLNFVLKRYLITSNCKKKQCCRLWKGLQFSSTTWVGFYVFIQLLYMLIYILLKKLLRTFYRQVKKWFLFWRVLFFVFSAHDVALSKQHKSISASDVLKALEMLEFTDMVEQLQGELQGSYFFFLISYNASCVCTSHQQYTAN